MLQPHMLQPHESNPSNNPNHPRIRCVDGLDSYGNLSCIDDQKNPVTGPYKVFDILNQTHVGPWFDIRYDAEIYMQGLGGAFAPDK